MSSSDFQALVPGRKKAADAAHLEQLQRLHDTFLAQWLQALRVLLPASTGLTLVGLSEKPYAQFLSDCPPSMDIEVFEVEAWQALCAWCFDGRWASAAVDCLFGGGARLPVRGLGQRPLTPLELGVRKRLLDSLASAYEAAWSGVHPIRLQSLRSEDLLANLRVAAASDAVLHLQLSLKINALDLQVHGCLPTSCLQWLRPATGAAMSDTSQPEASGARATPGLMDAPVELQAVLAHTELSVAQLMALSVGQVIGLQMHDPVPLRVRGVQVGTAQHGLRNGHYAVRLETMAPGVSAGSDQPLQAQSPAERLSRQAESLLSGIDLNLVSAETKPTRPAQTELGQASQD
jgi:flagellar motor switch protein FliM